jgi:PadR family transcriptional regulator, regulatory protein PadR
MGKRENARAVIPSGVLDLLILRSLAQGSKHGYDIAEHIERVSEDVLQLGEGTLYPTLQRLLIKGWVVAEWGLSANNRRARYYRLTAAGRKQLGSEMAEYQRVAAAIAKVLAPA